jgi:hypothetical protein
MHSFHFLYQSIWHWLVGQEIIEAQAGAELLCDEIPVNCFSARYLGLNHLRGLFGNSQLLSECVHVLLLPGIVLVDGHG